MLKSVWASDFWKPLVHTNMSGLLENIPSVSHISTTFQPLLFTFESCVLIGNLWEASLFHNCGQVNFPVQELIPKVTRPLYECLKILNQRPAVSLWFTVPCLRLLWAATPLTVKTSLSSIILVHSSILTLRLHFYEQPPSFNGQNVCAIFDRWTRCSQVLGMVTSYTPTKLWEKSGRTNKALLCSRL